MASSCSGLSLAAAALCLSLVCTAFTTASGLRLLSAKGGTFIQTSKPLEVGTEFVFKLFVPTREDPIEIKGAVKWIVTPEDLSANAAAAGIGEGQPGMGIRFIYREDVEREAVADVVNKLMVDSLGPLVSSKLMTHMAPEAGDE